MATRFIETEDDRKLLMAYVAQQKLPFGITIERGRKRSADQNRLQRLWVKEIADQIEDQMAEEIRGLCKLQFGVPILRHENEAFAQKYDRFVKPLPYEQKLAFMMEPLDMPVTRIMTSKQKSAYLDAIHRHYSAMGIILTDPGDALADADQRRAA